MYLRTLEQIKRYKARDEGPYFTLVTSHNTSTKKNNPPPPPPPPNPSSRKTQKTIDRFEDFLVEYPVRVISVAVCFKSRLSFIVRVNVVLDRTVVVDGD